MQLLTQSATNDFDAFKSAFDQEAEKRMDAGLSLLQMWRDPDDANAVLCLFDVNDRARAQNWLDAERQTGQSMTGRFLKTV